MMHWLLILLTLYVLIGVQVLLFTMYTLVKHRSDMRLSYSGGYHIVLFWPDFVIGFIQSMREGEDDEQDGALGDSQAG